MQTRRQTKEAAAANASAQVYHHNISHTNDSENDIDNDIDNDNNEPQIYKVFEYDENDKGIFEVNIDFDGASGSLERK